MSEKSGPTKGFRPWPGNRERLEYAERLGITPSQVINEVLEKHLRDYLLKIRKEKATQMQQALEAPVP
jgi:hypothetical protein